MIGRTLSHYEITAKLGEGGMGEVYRATDSKLGRDVALKVLPAEMASSPERLERFRREAKALAALDHPGIVTVFSVEEAEGVHFLTMQLVEGQPLDRLTPESGLPAERILEIAVGLADALAAAHDKGIVHRDLKPANVMVAKEGRVRVLDFGLARMNEAQAEGPGGSELATELLTREGVVMGTVPYMSPEQVAGSAVDHRTDIFSLGVILYEMATGWRPFQGHSSAELASAILRDTPRPLGELRADLPDGLAEVIGRCLEKSAADRIPSARALREALSTMPAVQPSAPTELAPASRPAAAADSGAARAEEGFWVAVLPFKYKGADADLGALAEGLSEEIVTGLSRFSYLRVIARSSTEHHAGEAVDVRSVGKEIGARYVMEGSLRQAGTRLRLAVQLVDATTGAHLWAENYERKFSPDAVFELQDDLVPRIVSTVADTHGVLPRRMAAALRSHPPGQLSPYEAVLRSFAYFERLTGEELAAARSALELAVDKEPAYADAWAMLALLYAQDHGQGFDLWPDSLARGANAARRAVEAAPSNHLAHFSLAQVLFFQKEHQAFRNAAERAATLNPMDGNSIAFLGELLVYSGDTERGLELAGRAKQLNPHHPGWYWFADYYHFYSQRDYAAALDVALKMNMPGHWGANFVIAAACGQLGKREAAGKALRRLLELRPDTAATVRRGLEKWWEPEYVEQLIDGLRKAGLEVPEAAPASEPGPHSTAAEAPHSPDSGAARADEGFWVAVLSFGSSGGAKELAALAEGMTEEIVTGLSRFPWLRVISRSSTLRYADKAIDVREVGREIGARYVMEGSLRHASEELRVAVQLVDASTGAHLWAETYNRPFEPDQIFAIQDDLVPRIVSTCADHFGVLARAISEAVRGKPPAELTPYEALMRGFGYHFRLSSAEHAEAREVLERAVEQAPDNADCWAMLSWVYSHEHAHGFNPLPDSLDRALAAARRAVDLAPSNHLAQQTLAVVLFFRKEMAACLSACERALALNPLDGSNEAVFLIAFMGDWDRGRALIGRAMELNPHHPGWYRTMFGLDEYRKTNYRAAVDETVKANLPDFVWTHFTLAAAYGQLGEHEAARAAVHDLLARRPDFAQSGEEFLGKWFAPQMADHLIEGLRKAGLELPGAPAADPGATAPPEPAAGDDAGSPPPEKPRDAAVAIAVLPFSDMSPETDQEYLCEGMAEEIMNALVGIAGIRVASRTSAFRASREGHGLASIGRLLGVGQALEGSVRIAGGRLRVTAQLSDVETGYQLWSERYDRPAEDVFAIQDEIAAGVVEAVESRLTPGTRAVPARPQARNLEAYRWYLKARHLRGKEDHEAAQRALEEALRLDPSHAPSWTGLAEIKGLAALFSLIPAREGCAAARQALATAAELQGESAEGLHAEALVAFIERRWAAMEATWHRALELQPTHVLALGALGLSLCTRQRLEDGLPFLERAREADPLASFPYARTAVGFLTNGRPEEALRYAEDALTFEKEDVTALLVSCMAKVALGRLEEGVAPAEEAVAVVRRGAVFVGLLGWALATAGRDDEARAILEELRARPAGSPTVVSEAWLLGALGEVDEAFDVIARAEEEYQALLYFTGFPAFDPLRADPRFAALLTRLEVPSA